jgi:hypothetical protein
MPLCDLAGDSNVVDRIPLIESKSNACCTILNPWDRRSSLDSSFNVRATI